MNIKQKLEYAKQHVRSLARHDDAPETEVADALNALGREIASERDAMAKRRAKAKKAKG